MNCKKRQHTKFFFKLLLLAVYFVFFTVQLFLRYTSSHSLQSLDLDNYRQKLIEKSSAEKTVLSTEATSGRKSLSYLNKRFHPKNTVILPDLDLPVKNYYAIPSLDFYFIDGCTAELKTTNLSLRGPPAFC